MSSTAQTRAVNTRVPTARRDFTLLWGGQTVSLVGDRVMALALPLLAVETLASSAGVATLLATSLYAPFLVLSLPAGAIVEGRTRRTTMIVANGIQFLLVSLIWLLAWTGGLTFPVLVLCVLLTGCCVVFFQVAYTAYLPTLLKDPDELHTGNARLALSESLSQGLGPLVGGALIGLVGVVAICALNALSFLVSVLTLSAVRHREPPIARQSRERGWMRRDIAAGLRFVRGHRALKPLMACSTIYSTTLGMIEASLVLYCLKVLHLTPTLIGVVVGASAAGYPIGNLISTRMRRRFGPYRALVFAAVTSVVGILMMPAFGSIGSTLGTCGLVGGSILHSIGEGTFNPMSLTVRQTESPTDMLTRIGSVQRFFVWGGLAVGSLLAAGCTSAFGLTTTMWTGALGTIACLPALFRGRFRDEFSGGGARTATEAAA
jgi:MFS family permease